MDIRDFMTPTEAAYRWDMSIDTIKSRLKIRRRNDLDEVLKGGLAKRFRMPGSERGEWILTKELMEKWYGPEPMCECSLDDCKREHN